MAGTHESAAERAKALHPERCVSYELRKLSRSVTALYDQIIGETGIRSTQYTLLAQIAALGTCSAGELARITMTDPTTLTRNLAVLQRRDLVAAGETGDGRVKELKLTRKGNALLVKANAAWHRAQSTLKGLIGERTVADLMRALKAANQELR